MSAVMATSWKDLPEQEPAQFATPRGDERKRLMKARTALVLNHPFFGILALRLTLTEAPWVRTAGVDGKRFYYNPAYIAPLTDEQIRGLWGHEVMHCSNGHIWRRGERERRKWNWACDYAIDPILVQGGLKVPNQTINPRWAGFSAEQIYPLLPDPKSNPSKGGSKAGKGDGTDQASGGDPRAPDYTPDKDVMLEPDAADSDSKQMMAEWKEATISAAKAAKAQGKLPGNLESLIEEMVRPRVDWRSVLARFMQSASRQDYTWSRPASRHVPRGYYLPKVESESLPPMAFIGDVSGSHIDQAKAFFSECQSIITSLQPEKVYFLQHDTRVTDVQELEAGDPLVPKVRGGGGTDFRPVFKWFKKRGIEPACMVFCTDTYGTFPEEEPSYPVLWATYERDVNVPFGEVLYIGDMA